MTTVSGYDGLGQVLQRLDAVYLRRRLVRLATGLAVLTAAVLGSIVVAGVSMGVWPGQPPAALRWTLLGTLAALWAGAIAWFCLRVLLWRQNPAQNARFVEQALPALRNDLINAVLLASDEGQPSRDLVRQAIGETARTSQTQRLENSVSARGLKRWSVAALAAATAVVALAVVQPGLLGRGLLAVVQPTRYVPTINRIELLDLQPRDATVFADEQISVVARIRNDAADELDAELIIEGAGSRPMLAGSRNTVFTCPLGKARQTIRYAVRIGGSRWPAEKPFYTIEVIDRVQVEGLDLEYEYPAYTHLESKTVRNAAGPIEAPVGTKVRLALRLSRAVPSVVLDVGGASREAMTRPMASETTYRGSLRVDADKKYRLLVQDARGRTVQQCPDIGNGEGLARLVAGAAADGYYPVRAAPDPPPRVAFLVPSGDVSAPPGGKVPMKIKATDTYGLTDVRLVWSLERSGRDNAVPLALAAGQPGEAVLDHVFVVPAAYSDDGRAVIVCYAQATDNRVLGGGAGPQTSQSKKIKITVQDAAKVAAEKAKRYDELRKRLLEILKMQEIQRVNTELCWRKHTRPAQIAATGRQIVTGQGAIRAALLDLVRTFPFEPEMIDIHRALGLLASNEAQVAIDQAQVLAGLGELTERDKHCGLLAGTQDRIIDTLRTLLAILPSLTGEAARKEKAPGEDLPADVQERLRKLKAELEKFIDQQRKVIEASRRLAKTPVDDFTRADEKLLSELAAVEDQWEKFLNEAFTDFSKLAQQDFSNPSMLQELLSVKTDVTMAKDALSKKATEIATALEDNGIENATELTANLEKWLPDEPDRIKWAMEDPVGGQENIEQPELPGELEDLVGDLLEQEEDLFEEMEDLASKYTMSGDKGIGWDAMDGPISNMNAQGVTGNQLPNPMELSGRSGEGRQGKSTGEFVQDEAVGKGGRRTPTRLTPEPFQTGQVKDKSTEPPGGATGGGKISGAGEEGLEGPVPPPLAKELPRLARKQAALVNRAERIQARFETKDYTNFRLEQIVQAMGRVRNELARYRYHNALRAKNEIIGSLRQTKWLLAGRVDVAADSSEAMPKYIRDNIADAMRGTPPAEFEDAVRQYHRRLGELYQQE